jgi:hypothetical protein
VLILAVVLVAPVLVAVRPLRAPRTGVARKIRPHTEAAAG